MKSLLGAGQRMPADDGRKLKDRHTIADRPARVKHPATVVRLNDTDQAHSICGTRFVLCSDASFQSWE